MLGLTGTAIAGGVAGCSESGNNTGTGTPGSSETTSGDGDDTETTQGSGELRDPSPTNTIGFLLSDRNFNRYARTVALPYFTPEHLLEKNYAGDIWRWQLLEEDGFWYDSETNKMHYKFRDTFYWWDGTQVTAEDYYTQQEMARLMDPEGSDFESHELVDDFHVTTTRKEKLNPVLIGVEEGRLWKPRSYNQMWIDKFEDASNQTQRDEVIAELTEYTISTQDLLDEGLGCGVFKPKSWNEQEVVLEKFDKHPQADQCNFDETNFLVSKNTSTTDQYIINDEIDWNLTTMQDKWSNAPDHMQTVYKGRSIQPRTLVFDFNHKHMGSRGVRRAFYSLLDWEQLREVHNRHFIKQYQSGLPAPMEAKWLGQDFLDSLIKYPIEPDTERAAEFLRADGYEKSGGVWQDGDGETVSFRIYTEPWPAMAAYGESIAQQSNNFGFQVESKTGESATWYQDFLNLEGGEVFPFGHGWANPHPLNWFNYNNHYKMRLGPNGGAIKGWLDDGETTSPFNGKPLVIDLPNEVGAVDTSGGSREVNLYEIIEELKVTQSEERTTEITKTLSQYFNYDLPLVQTFPTVFGAMGDTQDFTFADDGDPVWLNFGGGLRKQLKYGHMDGVTN